MYEYLIGSLLVGLVWLILYSYNKRFRKEMMFGSLLYPLILIPLFLITKFLSYFIDITWRYVPDYFNPNSLLNLSRITGGVAIEDFLFMFFVGGIAAVFYELVLKRKDIKANERHHILSILSFFVSYIIIAILSNFNPIYNLIISSFIGFIVIIVQRPDLLKHSLYGALTFTLYYFVLVIGFNIIFPDALQTFWNLKNLIGITILKAPIEELLYAFSFGLMWAPIYEYVKGYRIK